MGKGSPICAEICGPEMSFATHRSLSIIFASGVTVMYDFLFPIPHF